MNKLNMTKPIIFFIILSFCAHLTSCDVLYKSRIVVTNDRKVLNQLVTVETPGKDVDAVMRSFLREKGYSIQETGTKDSWFRDDFSGENILDSWLAYGPKGPYDPAIAFIRSPKGSTIIINKLSGPIKPYAFTKYTKEVYSLLVDKFGSENVVLQNNSH